MESAVQTGGVRTPVIAHATWSHTRVRKPTWANGVLSSRRS